MVELITLREKEIINKKFSGAKLTQNESNILSKSIRPKLKEMKKINSEAILKKLEYNQKAKPLEEKIKKIILRNIPRADSIILCGSVIQNNYKDYNDIDLIILPKNKLDTKKKKEIIEKIVNEGKKEDLNLDIQVYSKESVLKQYPKNPSLIYQLKDSKVIYGKLKLPKKVSLTPLDLKIKLDWSEANNYSEPKEIYYAIRNALLVLSLMNKKIDNYELKKNIENSLGKDLIKKLQENATSNSEKKLALNYLKLLLNYLENELKNAKWEKIELENL